MEYQLIKTEINTKSAKYRYDIVDETGKVVSSRKTHREYVAATAPSGDSYFGRVDLARKAINDRNRLIATGNEYWKKQSPLVIAYTGDALLEQLIGSK